MARFYFPADTIVVATGAGTPAALTLAPAAVVRHYSAQSGGSEHADLKAEDGTTNLPVNGSGFPFCDANGKPPNLWGPDGVREMWRDIGGGTRFQMFPYADVIDSLTNGARKNAANVFSGAVSFTSGTAVAFTTTPTVSGSTIATAANLATLLASVPTLVAFLNATSQPYTVYINPTTGVWPNSGARVHMSGTAMTGFTGQWIWDSQSYIGATEAAGRIDTDLWDERLA